MWPSAPWSVPAGSIGSLPPGCHACHLSEARSELPGGAGKEKNTPGPSLKIWGICKVCVRVDTYPRHSVEGLW